MSPDFRYHIASLAAVFLALGVGILIGTAFVGAPVVNRQTRLIGSLEANVNGLRRETTERQQTEEALRELLPGIVRGKLAGKRILLVQTGTYADAVGDAAAALRLAGAASVSQVALPAEAWDRRASGDPSDPPTEEEIAGLARHLAPLLSGASNDALATFRDRGLLTGDTPLPGGIHYIVLIGGETNAAAVAALDARNPLNATPAHPVKGKSGTPRPRPTPSPDAMLAARLGSSRDAALIGAWQAQGITVVGTEPFDVDVSGMRAYQSAGIATIDSVDRAIGKIALPFALLGEKGNYGMKPTADRVLPASLEQAALSATPIPTPSPMGSATPAL